MILVSLTVVVSVGPAVDAPATAGDAVVFDGDRGCARLDLDAVGGDEAGEGEVVAGEGGAGDRRPAGMLGAHGHLARPVASVEGELAVAAVGEADGRT